jgi:hypothetical protein
LIKTNSAGLSWRCRCLLLALLAPFPALAWNAAGHRLVACVAWDDLDQTRHSELSQLLREHPDYERWRRRGGDGESDRSVFIEASTWPDEIRKDNRFYSAGIDAPTATQPGFPDMERRRSWHYVNRPLSALPEAQQLARSGVDSGLLDRQLVALALTLGSADASGSERSYALPWLIHLVGDAHQPLHTSTKLDAQGRLDKLGNGLTVINPFNPRKPSSTLHAFWDDLPGPPWLRGERLDAACRSLSAAYPRPEPSRSGQWINESWEIARNSAYPPGDVPTLTAEFNERAEQIANRRVVQAGHRLANLLRGLLGSRSR